MTAAVPRPTSGASIADPATYVAGVPHAVFRALRRDRPVAWIEEPRATIHGASGQVIRRGSGFWAVMRHASVAHVCRHPDLFSSAQRGAFLVDPATPAELASARQLLINMDDPHHAEVRRAIGPAFTAKALTGLVPMIQGHARDIGRRLQDGPFDVVRDLAAELPLLVLADLLGLPRADRDLLYRWSIGLVGFDDPAYGGGDVDAFKATIAEAFEYALGLAAERRRRPRHDLVTALLGAEVDGRRLTASQYCHLWLLLVVAGNETTRHLLAGSLEALAGDDRQRARLADDPALTPAATEELLRYVTPIIQFRRTATKATELDGQRIEEGDKVVVFFSSANRDEAVFPHPDELDLGRAPNPHLAFGVGPHFCLGAHLARLEATIMLDQLRPHLHGLALLGPPVRMASNFMNSLMSLPARFAP